MMNGHSTKAGTQSFSIFGSAVFDLQIVVHLECRMVFGDPASVMTAFHSLTGPLCIDGLHGELQHTVCHRERRLFHNWQNPHRIWTKKPECKMFLHSDESDKQRPILFYSGREYPLPSGSRPCGRSCSDVPSLLLSIQTTGQKSSGRDRKV